MELSIPQQWAPYLNEGLIDPHLRRLETFLAQEQEEGRGFYPPAGQIFHALELTPLDEVRAVILGQDPYHQPGQAMGLCFSVPDGVAHPPSLRNILAELHSDLGHPVPSSGDLSPWARRGVLLLNTTLTVSPGRPQSHAGLGWEQVTDQIIAAVNYQADGVVFLLWGKHAQAKAALIDTNRHRIISSNHPSPLSATKPPVPFVGSHPFSRCNRLLEQMGRKPIDWRLA